VTIRLILATALAACVTAAAAQTFPSRVVRVVVPQPPGGGFDAVARTLSEPLAALLGQPVIVENRPGGGTFVGTEAVAKAEPDGYTLLLGASANLTLNPGLYDKLPYDPKDFVPVGIAATFSYTLIARNDLPHASLREIIAHARANPGKLTYASGGNGTGQHIAAAVLFKGAGADITHVPYKGAQAVYQDLIPGRVDLFFDNSATARPHVEGGRVKAVAVSSPARLAYHPEVPTVRETGALDFEMVTFVGYFARSATPPAALARLRADFDKAMAQPEVAAMLEKRGARPVRMSVAEAEALVARDRETWTQLIRNAGIRAD
jgi:tripartite-type tricarboxylate transporter receptor subunit TctC